MPRPFKTRRICCEPDSDYFKPRGIPVTALEEVSLSLDELEAMRLGDLEGMYQEEAAKKMNISRQTYGRVLISARKKISQAIVIGKALCIQGGANNWVDHHENTNIKNEEVKCHAWKKWNGAMGTRAWNW